ncbi:hypothetical protein JHK82_032964 [Glycine max]|uniref:Uncharacterized protein n=2 Tax=Glycine subgen. Soja TaxID=1462606 RepID=C6T615_SOYBN|nr:unknown [Glycine max]KAG4967252.1 hypothetical protein JHK87_032903 [Glycine soja]KAG4979711.1 hypothetical protein JHK85_033669 [Glycine max]KAG4985361.1 hypothetical protein JHK86_033052 [Glycine max]KAG5118544.1 hypothetical protein JHK82_032964 [Glycine max]
MARKCNSTVSTSLINMLLSGSPTTCSSDSSSNLDTQVGEKKRNFFYLFYCYLLRF